MVFLPNMVVICVNLCVSVVLKKGLDMQPWQNPELEEIKNHFIEWTGENIAGDREERDREGVVSAERWKKMADKGALGICLPEAYGGQGAPVSHAVAAYEGIGYACHDNGFIFALLNQFFGVQMTLNLIASDKLKETYLPKLISGERQCAYAFTEDVSGSDAFTMKTTATRDGEGFRLNGTKCYLTNSPHSDLAVVFARTGEGRSPFALTAFLVDMDWEGASHGRDFEKFAYRTVHMGEMIFDNVFIPADHVIGRVGAGLQVLTESTGWERAIVISCALGPMGRTVDECVARAKSREQYGKPIGAYQGVSSRIANMIMRQQMSRLAVYNIAAKLENGNSILSFLQEAAMTKLFVSDNYIQTQQDAVQIFGVRGILLEHPYQQDLRDSLATSIWAGTTETLKNTVAKMAGLPVE